MSEINKLSINKEEILKNRILVIGIAIALFSLWYGYARIYRETAAAMRNIKSSVSDKNQKSDILKRIGALQVELRRYNSHFAKTPDTLWLVDKVSKAANNAGLKVISLSPKPLAATKAVSCASVNISLSGTFNQLGAFAAEIENSKEFIHIQNVSFKKEKEFLNAQVIVDSYFWK